MPTNKVLIGLEFLALYMSWPVIHAAMKRYQQANIKYGNQPAIYSASIFSLVKPYLLAFALGIGIVVLLGILFGIATSTWAILNKTGGSHPVANSGTEFGISVAAAVFLILYAYAIYLVAGPFIEMQIWNRVWNNTRFSDYTVRSDLEFWPFLKLQTVNLILTLLTLGLYRPFAVVRTYRYRLSCMTIRGGAFDNILQLADNQQIAATGDSSADLFGIDLSF
jgi:uncharacterized membrane protein YjgN (DUF898 family)